MQEMVIAGKGLAKAVPTFGVTMVKRGEKTAAALARLAANNDKILDVLETVTQIVPALDLGETVGALFLALMVDMGRVNPDALLPTMFGVRETWHDINDDNPPSSDGETLVMGYNPNNSPPSTGNGAHVGMPEQMVPPRFEPIRTR